MHVKVLWPSFRWRHCTLGNTIARAQSELLLYKYFVNMAKKRIKVATFARAQSTMGQASDWICNDINRCWLISENCKIQHNIK